MHYKKLIKAVAPVRLLSRPACCRGSRNTCFGNSAITAVRCND